ncbi:MAG: lipoate--protein ligase family protein [Nitrospirae bacterium]|nr:lipoate--protein ligase family protein [Nitrospirota bacterium]
MSDKWRFVDSGLCNASYNMALDEAIAINVRKGNSPPTLRLYGWSLPSVSIGYSQKMREIDSDYCIRKGIPIVRRPTGGRAILHNDEITYSFSVKTDDGLFSKGLLDSYKKISNAFVITFLKIGLSLELRLLRNTRQVSHRSPLCFESLSYGEITVNNKKILGSAQKRWTDGLLQQGSIPISIDRKEIAKVFTLQYPIGEKLIGLKELLQELNCEELKNIIKVSFEEAFNKTLVPLPLSGEEKSLAHELENKKYLSHSWNFIR